jgi:hypothetical protein
LLTLTSISNDFDSLFDRLVLDVLFGKDSRDYECGIKLDEDFETSVHELRVYFGVFKLAHTCESILCFYTYDGVTNYVKCKTGELQDESSGIHVFLSGHTSPLGEVWDPCLVTVHLCLVTFHFKNFPELRVLPYVDDVNIIVRFSQALKLTAASKPVFKSDGNLAFNMVKIMTLGKRPTDRKQRVTHIGTTPLCYLQC